MTQEYRKQYGYASPYARKIDLTTMARLKLKHVKMTEEILDAKFPHSGLKKKPEQKRLKTEESGRRIYPVPTVIDGINPNYARQLRLSMRECDLASLDNPKSRFAKGSFSP